MISIRSLLLKTELCKSMDKVQIDCKAGLISFNGAKKMNPNEEVEVKEVVKEKPVVVSGNELLDKIFFKK